MTENNFWCTEECSLDQWEEKHTIYLREKNVDKIDWICLHLYPSLTTLCVEEEADILLQILNSIKKLHLKNHIPYYHLLEIFEVWPENVEVILQNVCFKHMLEDVPREFMNQFFSLLRRLLNIDSPQIDQWCLHATVAGKKVVASSNLQKMSKEQLEATGKPCIECSEHEKKN